MDFVKIDNKVYDCIVEDIEENFNILYSENTGRTLSVGARMTLDALGTFIGHRITFSRKQGKEAEFDELFDYVMQPRNEGVLVNIVHGQTTISYEAYISNGARKLNRITKDGKVNWGKLALNIVPMEAYITP